MHPQSEHTEQTIDLSTLETRELNLADILILEKIGVRLVNPTTGEPVDLSLSGILAILFMMTTTPDIIYVFDKGGAKEIERRVTEFAGSIPVSQIGPLAEKFGSEIKAMFSAGAAGAPEKSLS